MTGIVSALADGRCIPMKVTTPMGIILACREDNDLHQALTLGDSDGKQSGGASRHWRCDSPAEAVEQAPRRSGVLLLADDYPSATTAIDEELLRRAEKKKLRLYIEYPTALPGVQIRKPRKIELERAVVVSDFFAPQLARSRILEIHGCRFVPVEAHDTHLVLARVAGFDSAVFGRERHRLHSGQANRLGHGRIPTHGLAPGVRDDASGVGAAGYRAEHSQGELVVQPHT